MSKYHFDTDDGQTPVADEEGLELDDVEAARLQAQAPSRTWPAMWCQATAIAEP
jgi:hypothetical protein